MAEKVTQDIGRGKITPTDGEKLMNIFGIRSVTSTTRARTTAVSKN